MENNNPDRLLFLDYIRGLAIIGVIFNHAIVYGIMKNNQNAMTYLPQSPLIVFAPTLIFGTWAGIFSVITGIANIYVVYHKLEKGISLKRAIQGPLVNSIILLFCHIIYQLLFTRGGKAIVGEIMWFSLFTGSIFNEEFAYPDFRIIFLSDALSSIAMSGFFSCVVMWFMWNNQDHTNLKRNKRILTEIGAIWLAISPFLWNLLYYRLLIPSLEKGGIMYIFSFPLSLIACHGHGILPYGGFTAFGMVYGIFLAQKENIRLIQQYARKTGYTLLGFGLIFILFHLFTVEGNKIYFFFTYIIIPPDLYLLNLGIMIIWIEWFIRKFEYIPLEQRNRIKKKTRSIRKFGKITLTLYCLEPLWSTSLASIFRQAFSFIEVENDVLMEIFSIQLLYLLVYIGSWLIILRIWDKKFHYKYSFEFWFVKLGGLFRKEKSFKLAVFEKDNQKSQHN